MATRQNQPTAPSNSYYEIGIIGALFFIFGFITWLNGTLIPYLKIACELNNFQSYFVAFAFYIAYFVMALPAASILEKVGFKNGMSLGLLVMAAGALLFIPAAMTRMYLLFLLGLFIIGTGLAILQTASNPYISILGPKESAAQRISIMGICNKVAGVLSPIILGAIILKNADGLVKELATLDPLAKAARLDELSGRVILPYLVMAIALVLLALMIYYSKLPEIDTNIEDDATAARNTNKTSVTQFPHLMLGVLALFLYVGAEVIAGDTIGSFGQSQGISLDTAKTFTSYTLAAMVVGYILGILLIPKYIAQSMALRVCAVLGVIFSLGAMLSSGYAAVLCIALLGLANSLMWPAIFPLAIDGLGRFTKTGSSLLIMAIAGGALMPLLYGKLADILNPQQAYGVLIPCYLFIWYYGVSGYKIKEA
jgi:MFS transporter, FHS family, L-fucose permease